MKRKSILLVFVIVLVAGASAWWFLRPASPSGKVSISHQGLDVSVSYSRPYKKGRVIFGDATTGALQPDGQYWRLGANAATEITFSRDVSFAGHSVKAGTYRMYAIPGAQHWRIVLNSALGKSGSELPDSALDIVAVEVQPVEISTPVEQFTIEFRPDASGVVMEFKWDRTALSLPIA